MESKYRVIQAWISNDQLPPQYRKRFRKGVYSAYIPRYDTIELVNATKDEAAKLMELFDGEPEHYRRFMDELKNEKANKVKITSPDYFEDNQECGYCHRKIGKPHKSNCRQ